MQAFMGSMQALAEVKVVKVVLTALALLSVTVTPLLRLCAAC